MPTSLPVSLSNALRPAFTEKVIGWLERGKSVNVFGDEGQGIGRLAEDLAKNTPAPVRFHRFNMKGYADSCADFLQAVADALGIQKSAGDDIRGLLNNFLDTLPGTLWLCLEHFDRLAERQVDGKNVDAAGYDIHFLNYLNSLSNNPRVSLLVCSRLEIRATELYVGGKAVSGSRLEFSERVALPDLTFQEIEQYLERRMPDSPLKTGLFAEKPPFYALLIREIDAHKASVPFAEFLADKPIDPKWSVKEFDGFLKIWKKDYAQSHAPTIDRRIGHFEKWMRRLKHRVNRVFGIGETGGAIFKKLKLAAVLLAPTGLAIWKWGEQFWAWICSHF